MSSKPDHEEARRLARWYTADYKNHAPRPTEEDQNLARCYRDAEAELAKAREECERLRANGEKQRNEARLHVRALLNWLERTGADITGHPALVWLSEAASGKGDSDGA